MADPGRKLSAALGIWLSWIYATSPTAAAATDRMCKAALSRFHSQVDNETRWIGMDGNGAAILLRDENSYSVEELERIYYIHARTDGRNIPTVLGYKITYHNSRINRYNEVIVRNNVRRQSIAKDINDYQEFHIGGRFDYDLLNYWHLTPSFVNKTIPFQTYEPARRRRAMAYNLTTADLTEEYRSYLIKMEGVRVNGSCVPFDPVIPSHAETIVIEFIDLDADKNTASFQVDYLTFDVLR